MRIFTAALMHETNVFSPIPTNLDSFKECVYYLPSQDPDQSCLSGMELYGPFVDYIRAAGHELVVGPGFAAQPAGPCQKSDYEFMRDSILTALTEAGDVECVMLFLHGAQIAHGYDDCEGDLLQKVRDIVGPDIPVGALLDLHGNLSEEMTEAATALIACKEYPHTDYLERLEELLSIVCRASSAAIKPVMSSRFVPVLGSFYTTRQPMRGFVDKVCSLETGPILSISLMHGFAWSDTGETGANILVIADGDKGIAQNMAERLADEFEEVCREASAHFWLDVPDALDQAEAASHGPIVIADIADNAGGGAPSDSTFILQEIIQRGLKDVAIGVFWDPILVKLAISSGVGTSLNIRLGGKVGPTSGDPIDLQVEVTAIDLDQHGNALRVRDPKVALRSDGIEIVINSIREQVYSPAPFEAVGIDVSAKKIVVVKSTQHFFEGFEPIAQQILYCNTPGVLNQDLATVPFRNIRRPMWPLDIGGAGF